MPTNAIMKPCVVMSIDAHQFWVTIHQVMKETFSARTMSIFVHRPTTHPTGTNQRCFKTSESQTTHATTLSLISATISTQVVSLGP